MEGLSSFTSVFSSNNDNRVAKRNRRPLSCSICRARKLKCDRQQPCSSCAKKGESASCDYSPVISKEKSRSRSAVNSNDAAASRLQKLEDLVNGLMHATPPSNFVVTPPSSSNSPQIDPPAYLATSAGGHLSQQGAYVGGTHWASILERIHDIRSVMDSDLSDVPSEPALKADPLFGQERLLTIDEVLVALPERQIVDTLVSTYFKESFLSLTFIHSGKFQREYEGFWKDPSSASFCWLSILFSIMFMAAKIATARGQLAPSDPCDTKRAGALRLATKCLVTGQYLKAQPYSVEALLFHFHCIYALHADPDIQPWPILTMATRLAQKMGYHRDPRHLSAKLSPFESEMRRRAWHYIEIFDITMSANQGIPAMINEDECDCQFPINLLDEDFDENTSVMPPSRSDTTHIPMLFFNCKAEAVRLLRPIIRHALSSRRYDIEETNKLHDSLEKSRRNVPQSLRIRTIAETSFVDQDYLIMQRFMLELQYLKGYCILHRPYMACQKDDPAYEKSREICKSSALRQLDLQADYFQAVQPQGRLYQSRWMLTNVTLHEQFAAAMIVCLDLAESTSQSPESRARKLEALQNSRHVWSSKKPAYRDAIRASHVLGVMIAKLTAHGGDPPTAVQSGTFNIPNCQHPPTPANLDSHNAHWSVTPAQDTAHEMMDIASLESILDNPDLLNWNDIDTYLIDYSGGLGLTDPLANVP
ncbi:hypothetical protein AUEXF2481DRAFT_4942 [Aureobasidium subglaciale EXF-2481]|uniref:Zn(2)-C6 fungal-type domain-containing protein n=1 Tax=Aureobasidium subglaciale (strain EXF-2481) TaxID=1043005 RepID=A0A074Z917_AURSE|nr:uncharacterized protein AUEXF2481DRAFT_4942 [Aureobasidium subglaciale EXF-2481]KEQ95326.1 hypothetical protein AUEXF2481DRAFT_4942 [Aureobasidium subglaciale EXF-2481]